MRLAIVLISAVLLSITSQAHGGPIQWAGNGHYYDLIFPAEDINYFDAKTAAESMSFMGLGGHLVTVTSQEEHDFLSQMFGNQFFTSIPGIRPGDMAWMALTDAAQEGTFVWTTGEAVSFTAWSPGETNNLVDASDYVHYSMSQVNGWIWNDRQAEVGPENPALRVGYFVEFDEFGATAVPEPSSLVLLGIGGIALIGYGWRKRKSDKTD